MLAATLKPSAIVRALDEYVIGQDDAKRVVAVAVYAHFRKVALSHGDAPVVKSNVLLVGPSGTGKTLLCETLARVLDVPFVTAEATSLAQTRYVGDELQAILERLVDRAEGDLARAAQGIVFIDEVDKLRAPEGGRQTATSGESVQHALLRIMEGTPVKLGDGRFLDTTNVLFICGGAFVGLDDIVKSQTHGYGFIATRDSDNVKILERLNSRVKPTDLFEYGLIPEFTGRLPIVARFATLDRRLLARIMTEPRDALYRQFRAIFANEGVALTVEPHVFEQIAEIALEYKTGARSLRGIFEELMAPILYVVADDPTVRGVHVRSLFADPELLRGAATVPATAQG